MNIRGLDVSCLICSGRNLEQLAQDGQATYVKCLDCGYRAAVRCLFSLISAKEVWTPGLSDADALAILREHIHTTEQSDAAAAARTRVAYKPKKRTATVTHEDGTVSRMEIEAK